MIVVIHHPRGEMTLRHIAVDVRRDQCVRVRSIDDALSYLRDFLEREISRPDEFE